MLSWTDISRFWDISSNGSLSLCMHVRARACVCVCVCVVFRALTNSHCLLVIFFTAWPNWLKHDHGLLQVSETELFTVLRSASYDGAILHGFNDAGEFDNYSGRNELGDHPKMNNLTLIYLMLWQNYCWQPWWLVRWNHGQIVLALIAASLSSSMVLYVHRNHKAY